MKKLAPIGVALLLALVAWTWQSGPVAVIIQVDGKVQVERGGSSSPAAVGTRLEAGDKVVPSSGGTAVVIQRGGARRQVSQAYTVEAPPSSGSEGANMFSRTVQVLGQVATANTGNLMDRQGMIRPIPGEPVMVAPRNGLTIMTPRPTFTWRSVSGAGSYTLQIRRKGSRPVRFHDLPDTTWSYPSDSPPLVPGETYFWTVAPTGSGRAGREQSFTVIGPEGYAAVAHDLQGLGRMGLDPAGDGAFLAAVIFRNAKLYYDAAGALESIQRSGAALSPEALLLEGEVLAELGDAEGARKAFDRADEMRR